MVFKGDGAGGPHRTPWGAFQGPPVHKKWTLPWICEKALVMLIFVPISTLLSRSHGIYFTKYSYLIVQSFIPRLKLLHTEHSTPLL